MDGDGRFAFAPTGAPTVAVIGAGVWDLRSGTQRFPQLEGMPDRWVPSAVSADGTLFAALGGVDNVFEKDASKRAAAWSVVVWSLQTGATTVTFDAGSKDRRPTVLSFSGPSVKEASRWLVVVGHNDKPKRSAERWSDRADVWDVTTGKLHHSFAVVEPGHGSASISPDGRYLALVGNDHVHVYDVRAGQEAAVMRDPPADPAAEAAKPTPAKPTGSTPRSVIRSPRQAAPATPRFTEYPWSGGLAFSPDGRELALLVNGLFLNKGNRLIIWDKSGHVTLDTGYRPICGEIGGGGDEGQRRNVAWSPDGSLLMLTGGWLVDRRTGVAACQMPGVDSERAQPVFLDDHSVLASRSGGWERFDVPIAEIRQSLAALADPRVPAGLRPGGNVGLSVDLVGATRGDAGGTKADLTKAITADLMSAGLAVSTDGEPPPAVFRVAFEEKAGATLPVYETHSVFPMGGRDTGRKATAAIGTVTVELRVGGPATEPVWSQKIDGGSPIAMVGPIDDGTLRAAMLKGLCARLGRLVVPVFVPTDPAIHPLPMIVE